MACANDNGEYFDYKCYYEFKEYYDGNFETEAAKDFLAKYQIPPGHEHISKTSPLITKLTNNLASDKFLYYNRAKPCKYINYWLNEEIREKYAYQFTESNFPFFKTFADKFAIDKFGKRSYASNTCNTFFSYIPLNKYTTMHALYYIYGLYNKIKNQKIKQFDNNICSDFLSINPYYLSLLWNNKYDKELYEKLIDFRRLVLEEKNKYTGKCSYDLSLLMPFIEFTPPPVENSDRSDANSLLSSGPRTEVDDKLKAKSEEHDPHPKPEPQREEIEPELEKPQARAIHNSDISRQTEVLPQQVGYRDEIPVNARREQLFPRMDLNKERRLTEPIVQIDGMTYRPHDAEVSENTPDGILQKINGAFSSISEYVEPVPLMGVSGGMGALFLLLRYTPVGTFFRGGRGRVRRIPSGFHGQFIGAFPDIQDYDGGYVGYSQMNPLAE